MKGKQFISLRRVYFNIYNQAQGIIEVKQDYDILFNSVTVLSDSIGMDASFYVYNGEDMLIYPFKVTEDPGYMGLIEDEDFQKGYMTLISPVNGQKEVAAFSKSDDTGWTVVAVLPESILSVSNRSDDKNRGCTDPSSPAVDFDDFILHIPSADGTSEEAPRTD